MASPTSSAPPPPSLTNNKPSPPRFSLYKSVICWITKKRGTAAADRTRLADHHHAITVPTVEPSAPPMTTPGSTVPPPPTTTFSDLPIRVEFTFERLCSYTDGFSNFNLVGRGGFGSVYRGILPGGQHVAVKRLKPIGGFGESEFEKVVAFMSKLHHKNLLFFVGYCIKPKILVFDFAPNNTLDFHLHGGERPVMEFATRLRIAIGTAKALAYLHENRPVDIIYRDIKAANILLGSNFDPIVADFGLSKIIYNDAAYISTRLTATSPYLAPEYAVTAKLSKKSDVFSYGVILLELITGRKPEAMNLDQVRPLLSQVLEDGNFDSIVDPNLQPNYSRHDMTKMLTCADVCVREVSKYRPRMSMIVRVLEDAASVWELKFGSGPSTMGGA